MSQELTCPSCGQTCDPSHRFCPECGFPMEKLQESNDDPLIGCTLPGGHVVLELIDVGGMGRVYRAEQKLLGRTVAVKIIHPHLLGDETVEARFITEARAASRLNHPNSVGVIDFGKFDGRFYMVMEYLRGRDLATVAHEDGPLEIARVVDICIQTLAALEEAHALGIVHRDLKPENIVLSPLRSGGDFAKVLDFGLAKVREAAQSQGKRITDPGMVCGTPEYMAPEQARGEDLDHRADLYACGVMLFELLTGELPFDGATPREVVLMHLSKEPPEPAEVAPDRFISDALVGVVKKAMAKAPADRFQNAAEFAEALRRALAAKSSPPEDRTLVPCASCGAPMPEYQKFCGECGTRLTVAPPSASSPIPPRSDMIEMPTEPPISEDDGANLPLPLVGRDVELGWLHEQRAIALEDKLAPAIIAGRAGSGKTRLLQEFLDACRDNGDAVALAKPDPWAAGVGFYALARAIEQLAELPPGGGEPSQWSAASPDAKGGLELVFGRQRMRRDSAAQPRGKWSVQAPEHESNGDQRELAAEALRWALGRAQARCSGVAVLAVDDLHMLDGASANAFLDVVADPPLGKALLIATRRVNQPARWEDDAAQLRLRGIPAQLASQLTGSDLASAAEAEAPPSAIGEGPPSVHAFDARVISPLYIDQLLRFNREKGDDPPNKLIDLIALRAERLNMAARTVLQGIAVLGYAASTAQLVELLPDVHDVARYLGELMSAGFVAVATGPGGERVAELTHPLFRDATLASTPAGVRNSLHARARNLTGAPMPLEADAIHAFYAEQSFEALMLLERSADKSLVRGDTRGAVRMLHMAVDLARREMMRGELDDPVSALLMFSCKLGDALALDNHRTDAEGVLMEALNLAGPSSAERSRILASLASIARGTGRADAAYQRLDEALAIAEKTSEKALIDNLERLRQKWVAGA